MNTKTLIILILYVLIFTSCATLLNNRAQQISINTDKHIKVISVDSSLKMSGEKKSYYVERSKAPIKINLQVDSVRKTIFVKSKNSFAFWLNIENYGVGMLIDKDNPKRYSYPKRIYLQLKNDSVVVRRFILPQKGTIDWHIALPHANLFNLKTIDSKTNLGGFFGFETGVDYYYKNSSFISINAGVATNFPIPVLAPLDYWGIYQSATGRFVSVRNNNTLGRANFGYGLGYSRLIWTKTNNQDSTFVPQTKKNSALGFSFSSAYRFGKSFELGLLYQPYFLSMNDKVNLTYQHQLSLEFIWKVQMKYRNDVK